LIPPIPDQARYGFSRGPGAYAVAKEYWARLLQPVIAEAKLSTPWLTGGPHTSDISGSSIFTAVLKGARVGLIIDQQDPDQPRDEIGWFFNTWDPTSEKVTCLRIHCFLGPIVGESALALSRKWFIDRASQLELIEEFRDSFVG